MLKRKLPPPEKFTVRDGLQILLGLVMIPLGLTILFNTWRLGAAVPAILIGTAFVAFGLYRTAFAWGRLRWYMATRGGRNND